MVSEQGGDGGGVAEPSPETADVGSLANSGSLSQRLAQGGGRRWLRELLQTTAVLVISFLVVKAFVAEVYVVRGQSMAPTFQGGEWVLINKLAGPVFSFSRGDIVVYRRQPSGRTYVIKRILGMPGDRVEIRDDVLWLNGENLGRAFLGPKSSQPLTPEALSGNRQAVQSRVLVEGQVYVVGDARLNSKDSRQLGPVVEDDVVGKVVLVLWPPSRMKVP